MNVSFDVLGVSTSLRQQKDGGEQLRRELQCSLMVAHPVLESRPFDGARLNLLGQLKSNINGQKSTKAVSTSRHPNTIALTGTVRNTLEESALVRLLSDDTMHANIQIATTG